MAATPYRVTPTRVCLLLIVAFVARPAWGQVFRHYPKVQVSAETRIDWMYPTLRRSPAEPPEGLLDGYVSSRQRYAFYGPPPNSVQGRAMPLVLFISYRSTPIGWSVFGPTCTRRQVLFAEPLNAGNSTPMPERIRIVLDVLDDLRRRYVIDPDRTYIAGYSGGGTTAARIASALPEYFGGFVASNTIVQVPRTRWGLEQFRRRLSVVMFAGEREPYALNVGKLDGPIFAAFGIRSQYRVFPKLGHAMPSAAAFDDAFAWMEDGLAARRGNAIKQPYLRMDRVLTREQQAKEWFAGAKAMVEDESRTHVGLACMDALAKRWPDLAEGADAKKLFDEYERRDERPWKDLAKQERLERTVFLAQLYDREASGSGLTKKERSEVAKGALANWDIILRESKDERLLEQARSRQEPLRKLAENAPTNERNRRERKR